MAPPRVIDAGPMGKIDLTPRKHHGYSVVLFILGTLFPPLAVAARFGIGSDFFLNLLLTICGYIPGHVHNFYVQNIRNNKNHRRTPKWAQRYGLVDTTKIERNKKRSQWAARYNERNPHSALEGAELAEGEVERDTSHPDSILEPDARARAQEQQYWHTEEERYYGANGAAARRSQGSLDSGSTTAASGGGGGGSGGRWHYPANFEDSLPSDMYGSGVAGDGAPGAGARKKKKKSKKDRWERTEDAYALPQEARPRKKKSSARRKNHSTVGDGDNMGDFDRRSNNTSGDEPGFPEDPEGGLYGDRYPPAPAPASTGAGERAQDDLNHEF